MKRIAVVGSGEIGSRHLQGLAKSKNKLSLYVVDSNNDSLELSKKRYNEIPNSLNDIKFLNNISLLPSAIDIGIISTTSIHRKQLIESLLKISSIKYMILEKIVFQNVEDFDTVVKLFSKNNTKSWVNCNRRTFKIYQKIKEYIRDMHWFGSGKDTILTLLTENDDVYICGSGTDGLNTQLRGNNYRVPTPLIF